MYSFWSPSSISTCSFCTVLVDRLYKRKEGYLWYSFPNNFVFSGPSSCHCQHIYHPYCTQNYLLATQIEACLLSFTSKPSIPHKISIKKSNFLCIHPLKSLQSLQFYWSMHNSLSMCFYFCSMFLCFVVLFLLPAISLSFLTTWQNHIPSSKFILAQVSHP